MKNKKNTFLGIVGGLFFVPTVSHAAIGLVQIVNCDVCTLGNIPRVIGNLIWDMGVLSIPLAVAVYAWGGFWLLMAPASSSNKEKGVKIIANTTWGLVFIFTAWLIIDVVKKVLGLP
jgi:hypothetical protein